MSVRKTDLFAFTTFGPFKASKGVTRFVLEYLPLETIFKVHRLTYFQKPADWLTRHNFLVLS